MKNVMRAAAVAAAIVMFGSVAEAQQKWASFTPPDGGYRVDVPTSPSVKSGDTKTDYGPAHVVEAVFKMSDGLDCTIRRADYEAGAIGLDPQGHFNRVKQNFAAKYSIRSDDRQALINQPAMHLVVDLPNKRVARFQEVIIADRTITMVCIVPAGQETGPTMKRIFSSFAVIK